MKKKNRRQKRKHPALKVELNLKSRTEFIDYDYLNKLSEEELDYLNSFTEEYINANFNHSGERIHKTKLEELDSYSRNNSRNRCIYTKSKSRNLLFSINDLFGSDLLKNSDLEGLIDIDDSENQSSEDGNNSDEL